MHASGILHMLMNVAYFRSKPNAIRISVTSYTLVLQVSCHVHGTCFGWSVPKACTLLSTSASPCTPSCFRSLVACIAHALVEDRMLWAPSKCLYEQNARARGTAHVCMRVACFGFTAHACMKIESTCLCEEGCFDYTAHACMQSASFGCTAPAFTKVACCGDTHVVMSAGSSAN